MCEIIPLILLGGVAISAFLAWRLRRKKFRIAVLGARRTGKTTLINSWRGEWVADEHDPGHTQAPGEPQKTKLTVDGLRLTFTKLTDVSGASHAWPVWEDQTRESRYILYLIDARALTGELDADDRRNWYRLEDDTGQIGRWLKAGNAHLCVVVVTHADQDPRLAASNPDKYHEQVAEQIDPLILRLGGPEKTRLVRFSRFHLGQQAESFEFLGFEFRWVKDLAGTPRRQSGPDRIAPVRVAAQVKNAAQTSLANIKPRWVNRTPRSSRSRSADSGSRGRHTPPGVPSGVEGRARPRWPRPVATS